MIKYLAKFESNVEGRIGHFLLDHDTPVHIAKEMAFQFLKYLGQIEDQAKAQEQQKQNEQPVEESKQEVIDGDKQ